MKMTSRIVRLGVRALFLAAFSLVAPGARAGSCAHNFGAGTGVDYGNWITGTDYTCSKCGKVRHTLETNCTYTDKILHKLNADGTTSDVSETTEKPKTTPYLIWYKPEASKDNHKAFVYFPGGGYNNVDILNGGDLYGRTFAAKGYTVVICWYRGYNPKDDSPFRDANAAMLAVRAYAKTLGITEVGVAGDSAGGHLASYQHVHGTGNAKSDFAILAFPCITCGESTSYGFSGNIGATTAEKQRSYCNDLFVTATTGRAFIYVATSDAIVPCVNSYRFADALKAKGVPYKLHIYQAPAFSGNDHGFKITDADKKDSLSTQIDNWLKATPTTVDERTDYPGTIAVDAARNTYAWKGAAGAKWNAAASWTPSETGSAKGYPADMVYPIAAFSGDATVDLDGKEQYAVQFSLAAGKTLTVKNGTLKCVYHPSYAGANTLRIQNATVERPFYTTEPDKGFGLKGSDSALVLENGSLIGSFYHEGNGAMRLDATGSCSLQDFYDVGAGSGATLVVRDGTLAITGKGPYSNGGLNHNGGALTVALSNATVTAANVKHNGGTARFAIKLGANNTTATPVFKSAGADNLTKLSSLVFDIDATAVTAAGTYPIYTATSLTLPTAFDPAAATVRCVDGMSGTLAKNGNALELVLSGSPSEPEPPEIKYGAGYHPETGLTVREKTIACFGDSLTYGEGTTGNKISNAHFNYGFENNNNNSQTYNYPLFLQESLGDEWDVVNISQGGQTAESILAWQGGLPLTFGTAVTIPGDGSRSAAWEGMRVGTAKAAASARCFTEPNVWTDTYGAMTGTLDDGSRVRWQCHAWTHKDIARLAATGADKTYPVGTTFIPDSATHFTDAIQVICAGANNGNAAYATVIGFINQGLEKITGGKANGKYLIVSPHRDKGKNDSTAAMEAAYAAAFGEAHYLNLRREMATRGLQIAVAQGWMSQSAAEATTWDTPETGLLSSDNLHFNATGYRVFAYLVKEKLQALGYLGETPAPTHTHDWGAWTLVQEATCQQAGSSNRTCRASGCDIGTETVTIPKVGHVYVDGACKWCHAADPSGPHVGTWTSFGLAAADFVPMAADANAAFGRCTSRTYVTDGKLEKVNGSNQYGNNFVDISFAEATDISEVRIYSAWDAGRDGFGIDWVAVQTAGSTSFVNLNVAEFPYTNPGNFGMCAALKAPDGEKLASNVTAVRVHFSTCENSWIGLGEIEVRKVGSSPAPSPTAIAKPALSAAKATYSGQVQKPSVAENAAYTVDFGADDYKGAGTYSVTVSLVDKEATCWQGGGTDDLVLSYEIEKAPLKAAAADAEVTEGDAAPTFAVTVTGFVNGETAATAAGYAAPTASCPYTPASAAGTYDISVTGGSANNYEFTEYAKGMLTVKAKGGDEPQPGDPDTQAVTYTWTGNGGDGKWANRANWSSSVTPCYGYPDNETYAKAVFNGDATVDLCGESIETAGTDGQGVTIAVGAKVAIRNGTLKWNQSSGGTGTAVGQNATVTLEDVTLTCAYYSSSNPNALVFRGTSSLSGSYRPWNKSSVLEVRDGATTIGKLEGYGGTYADSRILVSNATLTVGATGNLSQGRPYLLQRGGKLVVNGTSGTTTINSSIGFSFEGGAFEAPGGLAVDFSGAKAFVVKAAAYGTSAGEHTLIATKGTLTLPDLADKLDVTGLPEGVTAELVPSDRTLKLVLTEASVHRHDWSAWTLVQEPTCLEAGSSNRTCRASGCDIGTETVTIPKVDHAYVGGRCKWCGADEPQALAWTHFGLAVQDFVPMEADENVALGCTATGAVMTDGKLNGKSSYQSNWASGPAPIVTFNAATDISEIRFYSSWDTGRDGFGIKEVNVRYDGETKFTHVESIPEFPYADENKGNMCAAIRAPGGEALAKNVIAVQIILGTCDNGWIGIGEIEVRKFSGAAPETSVKVDGADVPFDELFSPANEHRANSGSTIVFPTEPKVVTDEVTQVVSIECGGERVEVPAYYDVEVSGRNVALSLNEKARPGISVPKEESAPALVVTDEAFSLSADNIIPGFWYWLEMTPQLVLPAWSPCADSLRQAENADAVPLSASRAGEAGFYRVRTSDVKPALP